MRITASCLFALFLAAPAVADEPGFSRYAQAVVLQPGLPLFL